MPLTGTDVRHPTGGWRSTVPLTSTDVRHPTGGWRSTVPLTSTDARHLGFLEAICQVCAAEQGWEDLARQIPAVAADERNRPE